MNILKTYDTFYFVGIGGIGMSALARYFKSSGRKVLGYDHMHTKLTATLEAEGMDIVYDDLVDDKITSLNREKTLVVYTPAIKTLGILDWFKEHQFSLQKRAQVLGHVTEGSQCIAVAGTHGKTTTTTLISHLCKEADLPFSCFLGGISENFKSNFLYNGDEITVVEADEYDRSFLTLHPDWAVVTSIDADHLDIYGDKEHIESSFRTFAGMVKNEKQLFVRKDVDIRMPHQTYAVNQKANYYADQLKIEEDRTHFTFHDGQESIDFHWYIPGVHNVENATVAIAILRNLGVSYEVLQKGIASFKGIKRRYTRHVFENGKIYIDDYAHHPTELNAAIGSVHTFYPNKKLLVVFQPHLFSRTRDFAEGFAESLRHTNELLLLDIYPARELQENFPGITSDWLLEKVDLEKKEVCSLEEAFKKIKEKDFDVIMTIGAGNIDTLYDPIVNWLEKEK